VSPAARGFVEEVAKRLTEVGGAALLVDYGDEVAPQDSLRGIKAHRFVHPLHAPGEVDLSVDVDFGALRRAALAKGSGLLCPPLLEQRHFLAAMGIEPRVNQLMSKASDPTSRGSILDGATRLVESPGMGSAYKAFALAHPALGATIPGFEPSGPS